MEGAFAAPTAKTDPGRFFEDYRLGEVIHHATPRTLTEGERALYQALYPARHAIAASADFAAAAGLAGAPFDELVGFHTVFGRTVPDISRNAVANLGYAEGRFHRTVLPGDTLTAESEVIGIRQTGAGSSGIVWVRTRGRNQHGELVLDYVRWVMVAKRDPGAPAPDAAVPDLLPVVPPEDLVIPDGLDFTDYDTALSGETHRWADYTVGERIDHVDGVTLTEAEHIMATRLWQNVSKVHFDVTLRGDGRRVVYGGHILSLARALSFNGLANAQPILAINGGTHANPAFAGDTVRAWSEVLDKAETRAPGVGALRLRLVAVKHGAPPFALRLPDGRYRPDVLLDLDIWAACPL